MKRIDALIRPEVLELLRVHLEEIGYPGMTVSEARGHGRQRGVSQQWRGTEYKEYFLPKARVEIVVPDHRVRPLIEGIMDVCRTEKVGDGKIFIDPVTDAYRIRTGESGDDAL